MSDQPDTAAQSSAPAPEPAPAPGPSPAEEPTAAPDAKPETLLDAIADLIQMAISYIRQETAAVMRDKVVLPGQQLGMLIAFAIAAGLTLSLGIAFVAVALLLLLAQFLTWPGALGLIGGLLLIGAGFFTYLKMRSIQK